MRYVRTIGVLKKAQTKILTISTAVVLVATGLGGGLPLFLSKVVFADPIIDISTISQLRDAIEHQADGQTWKIEPGTYALTPFNDITAGGQTGWYLPITANNITINGAGNPTIYGDGYSANGNWSTQDLIAIFGNGVTINGLTLMPKVEPNKTIEVIGSDATIENTVITPNTEVDSSVYNNLSGADKIFAEQWGGSIYYNNATGTQTLDNVLINNGGISVHAPSATIGVNNVRLSYSTNDDWTNDYRLYVATPSSVINGSPVYTYHVSSSLNNFDSVLAAVGDPTTVAGTDTISLDSNLTTSKQVTLTRPVTLNGNGHTLNATFSKSSNSNNSALGIQADNITVNNLVEDGTGSSNLHGINAFDATGVNLNSVTVENNDYSGLNVDGSAVTINNLTTANNGWNGVDVDKTGAVLTVNGTSHHTGELADIYVDNASVGHVVDTNNQYSITHPVIRANDSAYNLKPAAPLLFYPANNGFINTNDFWFDWNDVPGAASYEFQASQSPSTDGNDSLNSNVWSGDYQHNQPTASTLHSVGASGTWYWQVRAVSAKGAKSDWSAVWKMTIDMTKPSIPVITAPSNGQYFSSTPILNQWNASTDSGSGIDHYQVAYLYDDHHTFGGSTCSGVQISGQTLSGCRDTSGTSRNHTPSLSEQGGVTIWVRAYDKAGNTSDWSAPVHYYYDATTLLAPALTSPANGAVVNGASLTNVWGSVNDATKYEYESFNSNDTTKAPRYDHIYTTTSKTATNVADGTVFWWRVRAIDQYGKTGPWSDLWQVTVDNINPTALITAPTIDQVITGSTLNITGTASDTNFDHYTYVIEDNKQFPLAPAVTMTNPVKNSQLGTWDVSSLGNGSYYVVLNVFDKAGNETTVTQHFTINNPEPNKPNNTNAPATHNAVLGASTSNPQNTGSGDVLGDSTTTPSIDTTMNNGQVKGDSTTNLSNNKSDNVNNSSNFLGLGWWWLLVLAVILGFFWLVLGKRASTDDKS